MRRFSVTMRIALGAGLLVALGSSATWAQNAPDSKPDSYRANNRPPDPRYKADILLVVAHPDDEVMATAYLAREIYENHKRVAVVYQTAGDEGNNDVGPEQAAALGDIRQIEARRAVGSLGITNVWFLGGHDTVSQNVLTSLEHCGHGRCLDELVRIVRITQPSVILTWLPDFATGENHADHQASGVLATEAFDLAGDPTVFSEQVSPASNPDKNANLTEGLRPWQPQKIYYFYNSTHDISTGQGPAVLVAGDLSLTPCELWDAGRGGVYLSPVTRWYESCERDSRQHPRFIVRRDSENRNRASGTDFRKISRAFCCYR